MSFDSLGLAEPLLRAVREKGYNTPSPIQAQAIPAVLKGQDIMAAAQTGTGKTAGFTLPLLQRLMQGDPVKPNSVRALVLTPTRELAAQVHESVLLYGKHLDLRSAVVFGGVSINPQMKNLRRGVDVLVATPGRLLDLHQQNAVKFNQVEILVLDEADRMLDMGFIHDIKKVLKLLPVKRQNLLFSATFSGDIRNLAKGLLNNPVEIDVAPRNVTTELVEQVVHPVDKPRKSALLSHLIRSQDWTQAIVFSRTKHGANKLVDYLQADGISSAAIHSNKSQSARTKALSEFKQGKVAILVATDIAARGLDIQQMPQVVNFDLPNVPEDYVHRIGRTGRAGMTGHAISLVSAEEIKQLRDIERLIKRKLPWEEITGYEARQPLPEESDRGGNGRGDSRGRNRRGTVGGGTKASASGARNGSNARGGNGNGNGSERRTEGQARPRRAQDGQRGQEAGNGQQRNDRSRSNGSGQAASRQSQQGQRAQASGRENQPRDDRYVDGGRGGYSQSREESQRQRSYGNSTQPRAGGNASGNGNGNRSHAKRGSGGRNSGGSSHASQPARSADAPPRKTLVSRIKSWTQRSA